MMQQIYENYNQEDQEVWNILFSRQRQNLETKGAKEYLGCLDQFEPNLNDKAIPNFDWMNEMLRDVN